MRVKKIIILNKKEGETPLEALEGFRLKHKGYKDVKMTYAGRLDPMASGAMLVLAGEEVMRKEKYLALDKSYDFEVLFGFATDTYDILGKVNSSGVLNNIGIAEEREFKKRIKDNLKHFTGKFIQKYPIYSSKTVRGKQLFRYGREGIDIEIPEREVFVKSLKFLKLNKINSRKLLSSIEKRIAKVDGDFRQTEILKCWREELESRPKENFFIGSFKIKCGSGTYVRGIAHLLGEKLGTPALAFRIKRTKVGKWAIK